jgi:hypothetical protein
MSHGLTPVTRDSAGALVMTIGLYLVYGAHLSPLWCWLPIGWMGANTESWYGGQKRILAFENKDCNLVLLHVAQIQQLQSGLLSSNQ